jgi:hypothetical protein
MTRQTTTNRDHEPSNHPSRASVRIFVLSLGVLVHSLVGIVVVVRDRATGHDRDARNGVGNGTEGNVATRRRTRGDDDDDAAS